jgi:RNA polymerase sigma-70 factor (ECF subfamily)
VDDEIVNRPGNHWLEPIPDQRALPTDADPAELLILRQSIRLAFVAALQHLPPKQRAALLLTEVLGWSAAEVADALDTSVAAVNSALQRARATMSERVPEEDRAPLTEEQKRLVTRYVEAFERYDMDSLASLLREDATLSMPPITLWLQGPEAIRSWMLGRGHGCRGSRIVQVEANGIPALAQYRPPTEAGGPYRAWALILLEFKGDRIRAQNSFLDTQTLFPRLGLPLELRP